MRGRAVVTGASKGIGEALSTLLAHRGYTVLGLSRSQGTNVNSPALVRRAFADFADGDHPATLLVNCAGIVRPGPALDIPFDDAWDQVATNFVGPWLCSREFVRHLHGRPARIVNVGSTSGSRPSPGWAMYGATKAALHSLTASLDAELKPRNVRVFGFAPGRCATDLRRQMAPDEDPRTIMQPAEVARIILDLIEHDHLAGQVIEVRR